MGWFWGDSKKDDPVNKLDPDLRDYLERERPSQNYVPTPQTQEPPKKPVDAPAQSPQPLSEPADPANQVPAASLFPDGRYAHLWKTYKPPTDPEEVGVRSAEKVIDKYRERKNSVKRAALENCALEQEEVANCFSVGNWQDQLKARFTLCSQKNAKFTRCFTTQSKFLQALGYASSFDNNEDDKEERIQMHADKLYHQMLDYEKRVEEAHAAGLEPPPLTSLFNPEAKTSIEKPSGKSDALQIPGGEQIPEDFKPSKDLEKLTPHERELEIRVHKANIAQQDLYVEKASPFMKSQEDARLKRQEKASGWFGETIGRWVT